MSLPSALKSARTRALLGLVLMVLVTGGAGWWAQSQQLWGANAHLTLRAWLAPLGWAAPFAFVGLKVFGIAMGLPASPVTFAGGALFGFPGGILLNVGGGTLGAIFPFAYARWWGREAVAERLQGRLGRWDEHLAERGFRAILFARLMPVLPFTFVNFAAGLSKVRFRDYLAGTLLGIVPGASAITYLGASAADGSWRGVGLALGFLGALALLPTLWRPKASPKAAGPQTEATGQATSQATGALGQEAEGQMEASSPGA